MPEPVVLAFGILKGAAAKVGILEPGGVAMSWVFARHAFIPCVREQGMGLLYQVCLAK